MSTKKQNNTLFIVVVFIVIVVLESSCVKDFPDQLLPNVPPKTFFWLYPSDTTIAIGISKQELRWWGEDQDGYIIGYLLSVVPNLATVPNSNTLTYTYVTITDSIISFPLRQAQQTFLVDVHAIDNTFGYQIPVGAKIKLYPFSYWDKNANGIFDSTDVRLDNLKYSMDLNGAEQRFPIKNTPPTINYVFDVLNDTLYAQPPLITFTVASFSWEGHDFDGDETIASYRLSLNDSTFANPLLVSSNVTTITLSVPRGRSDSATSSIVDADVLFGTSPNLRKLGTLSGLTLDANNTFYVQTVDVAGDRSKFLKFPSSGRTWYVKKPRGTLLMVIDYAGGGDSALVHQFYTDSVFAPLGITNDLINLRIGTMVPAGQHLNPALIKTLKLYNCVFWYADPSPSLTIARKVLFDYWNSADGGHLIYSAKYANPDEIPDAGHAYRDIAPLDSLGSAPVGFTTAATIFSGLINPDSSVTNDVFPVLTFKKTARGICIFPLYKNAAARYLYYLPATATYPLTNVGVIDGTKRVIFFNIPLDKISATSPNGGGVVAFFQKVFSVFSLQ